MKSMFFLVIFLSLTLSPVFCQIDVENLNKLFQDLELSGDFNGTILVAQGDEILFKANIGFADMEEKIHVTDSTVFELASMGKQFTAMSIMILKERKMLNYDDLIIKYFPSLSYKNVTVRHLLNMMSGIPDYLNFTSQWGANGVATNQDILSFYENNTPELIFIPGEKFEYSNTNYVILAEMVRAVSGISFSEFVKKEIFDKIGMEKTRSFTSRFSEHEIIPNYALQYVIHNERYVRTDVFPATKYIINASGIEGDGTIVSTASDLHKWTMSLKSNKLISQKTLQEAYALPELNNGGKGKYGFGIYIDQKKVWHWGGWPGIQTSYTRYLDKNIVVIYMKNVETKNWEWIETLEKWTGK